MTAFALVLSMMAVLSTTVVAVPVGACRNGATKSLPFCNSSLSFATRISDLLQRLTVAEKLNFTDSNNKVAARAYHITRII